jgi:hypothetical protein
MTTLRAAREPSTRGRCSGPARAAATQMEPVTHATSRVESGTMQTHTIYTNLSESITLVCEQCGRSKALQAAAVKDLPQPLKVRCPCGATFGVNIIIRQFYRKKTRLPGLYAKHDTQTNKILEQGQVQNVL